MITFGRMPHHCLTPVTVAVEAYSPSRGIAHGNLDATAYVCAGHVQTARAMWEVDGFTPYTTQARGSSHSCGDVADFREPSTVTPA